MTCPSASSTEPGVGGVTAGAPGNLSTTRGGAMEPLAALVGVGIAFVALTLGAVAILCFLRLVVARRRRAIQRPKDADDPGSPAGAATANGGGYSASPPLPVRVPEHPYRNRVVAPRDRVARIGITPSVAATIAATIGLRPAETGAMLGRLPGGVIDRIFVDTSAQATKATYSPHPQSVNPALKSWKAEGRELAGFVHSHPPGLNTPSYGDRSYIQEILEHQGSPSLVLPIVSSSADNGGPSRIFCFLARPGRGGLADISPASFIVEGTRLDRQFDRVCGAEDVAHLNSTRIVAIGAGGSRLSLENLARVGVGQIVAIDPDTIGVTNLATQHVRVSELGMRKVDALAQSIADVSPSAAVAAVPKKVEDLSRHELTALATAPLLDLPKPTATVIGLWADDFPANAFGHRWALDLGLPCVLAGLYDYGIGGEVALVFPGVTRSCLRCRVRPRYNHYAAGLSNPTTSQASPLWATGRMNSLKECITLATLQYASSDRRRGLSDERQKASEFIDLISPSPTGVMRLRPRDNMPHNTSLPQHERVFAGSQEPSSIVFDETIWLSWNSKTNCEDCGGTDDLRSLKGRIHDYAPFAPIAVAGRRKGGPR